MEKVQISFHDIKREIKSVGPIPLSRGGELFCEFRQLFNSEQAFIAQKAEQIFNSLKAHDGILPESGPLLLTPGEQIIHMACLLAHMNAGTTKQKYTWQEWIVLFDIEPEAFSQLFDELSKSSLFGEQDFLAETG